MALATYDNESPENIRKGDMVADRTYGRYTADSDAERDQWGQIVIRKGMGWATYAETDTVSITFDEAPEYI
jgi:hypothetical protein